MLSYLYFNVLRHEAFKPCGISYIEEIKALPFCRASVTHRDSLMSRQIKKKERKIGRVMVPFHPTTNKSIEEHNQYLKFIKFKSNNIQIGLLSSQPAVVFRFNEGKQRDKMVAFSETLILPRIWRNNCVFARGIRWQLAVVGRLSNPTLLFLLPCHFVVFFGFFFISCSFPGRKRITGNVKLVHKV